jgi:hypothetical protein
MPVTINEVSAEILPDPPQEAAAAPAAGSAQPVSGDELETLLALRREREARLAVD